MPPGTHPPSHRYNTDTQIHGYTDTRIHRYTDTQIHRYTDTQMHRYTDTQIHRYTDTQIRSYTDTQIHRYVDTQTGSQNGGLSGSKGGWGRRGRRGGVDPHSTQNLAFYRDRMITFGAWFALLFKRVQSSLKEKCQKPIGNA